MANIKINSAKHVKDMKPMHGGGQPPLGGGNNEITFFRNFHYITEAGIPYSRLHDVGGAFGGSRFVDIPNIFRNFDADENDPANYSFKFTDALINALVRADIEPYFRLGITIENQANIEAIHTAPPKDYEKWARICEHIIAHYTEGWADGFHHKITYWEIWNEPDNRYPTMDDAPQMWSGTPEEYYRLYDVTAKHLKKRFPNIKIGGYASCGFYAIQSENPVDKYVMDFFEGFMQYIKEHNSPIDFFSWHSYASTKETIAFDNFLHQRLTHYGYGDLERHLNEWNPFCHKAGTGFHAAEMTGIMISMQYGHTDLLCVYDMRMNTATYSPLFDVIKKKPIQGYYCMVAFNKLYQLKKQVECISDTEELYALAASDGERTAILISNLTDKDQELKIEGVDLTNARFSAIDDVRLLSWAPNANVISKESVMLIEI